MLVSDPQRRRSTARSGEAKSPCSEYSCHPNIRQVGSARLASLSSNKRITGPRDQGPEGHFLGVHYNSGQIVLIRVSILVVFALYVNL